jgi:type I restriction enzyme S subunit
VELKPGYKLTEVGVIPEEWEVRSLGALATMVASGRSKAGMAFGTYAVHGSTGVIGYTEKPEYADDAILAARVGANAGKLNLVSGQYGVTDNTIMVRLSSDCCLPFFWRQLEGKRLNRIVFGSGQPLITGTQLKSLPLSVPSLPEQHAIAGALGDVDALLGALENLIAKKRDLKQAAMQQLLTGQTRLPGFSGEWQVKRLGEIGDISSAGVDKKSQPGEVPVRLVNYLDVYRRDFIYSGDLNHWVTAPSHQVKRCAVQKGDVFFTPSSETRDDIGISAVAMEDIPNAAYSYHVVRLRLRDEWDLHFRTYAFKTRAFLDQAEMLCDGSGTRYVISQGKFKSMTVQVPPVPEQTAIAAVLSDMDAELAALEARLSKTRALKQGMMQDLLTGRTRLV